MPTVYYYPDNPHAGGADSVVLLVLRLEKLLKRDSKEHITNCVGNRVTKFLSSF